MPVSRRQRWMNLEHRRSSMPLCLRPPSWRGPPLVEQLTVVDWSRLGPSSPPADPGGGDVGGCGSATSSGPEGPPPTHKVMLLGAKGVGKSSLASVFGGLADNFSGASDNAEDTYVRLVTVDDQQTTLVVYDIWEQDETSGWLRENCLELADAYLIVFSVIDRVSFQTAGQLRAQLKEHRPSEDIPIILVGNKSDLVRSREVSVEDAQSQAASFECKYIETSAALHHNTRELFEGVVRQLRLRLGGRGRAREARRESVTERACRFLRGLVSAAPRAFFRQRSRSCSDLSVL